MGVTIRVSHTIFSAPRMSLEESSFLHVTVALALLYIVSLLVAPHRLVRLKKKQKDS